MENSAPTPPPERSRRSRRVRKPRLLRTTRYLRLASTIVSVILVVVLITAALFWVIGFTHGCSPISNTNQIGNFSTNLSQNSIIMSGGSLPVHNCGYYPINDFGLSFLIEEANGTVVGHTSVPAVTIAGGATYNLSLSSVIDLAPGSPGQSLLTNSTPINLNFWVNASYVYLLTLSVHASKSNATNWSAPFEGFAVRLSGSGAGTLANVTFTNQFGSTIAGTLTLTLIDGGMTCGQTSGAISVNSGSAYAGTESVSLTPGCSPTIASAAFVGPGYSFTLPEVSVA